jgi:hypothetical protein
MEGKVGGGTRCYGGVRPAAVGEGVWAQVRAAAMVVGSAHVPLSGIGRRDRARERDGEQTGDANVTVHDKLKRGS